MRAHNESEKPRLVSGNKSSWLFGKWHLQEEPFSFGEKEVAAEGSLQLHVLRVAKRVPFGKPSVTAFSFFWAKRGVIGKRLDFEKWVEVRMCEGTLF